MTKYNTNQKLYPIIINILVSEIFEFREPVQNVCVSHFSDPIVILSLKNEIKNSLQVSSSLQ